MQNVQISDLTNIIVSFVLYAIFLTGFTMLYFDEIKNIYQRIKMKNRLAARKKELRGETKLEQHLRRLLSVSMKNPIEPKHFLFATGGIYLGLMLIGTQNVSWSSSLIIATLVCSMPYLMLRVRLETLRRKGSYEGEALISEFLSQYRICNHNIYRTIEKVILTSTGIKVSKKLLFKLLISIRNTGDKAVIREATYGFSYGLNTNWSRMLANNIRISAEEGTNVNLALEDILIQLREARAMAEERKRLNSEALRIVIFLVPLLYFGTMIMSFYYLDIPFTQIVRNQLYTSQGFLLLLLIIFLFLVNLIIIEIVNNQRFDY